MKLDYKKFRECEDYVKMHKSEVDKIKSFRRKNKDGDYLKFENHLLISIQRLKELYSKEKFFLDRNPEVLYKHEEYLSTCLNMIFDKVKLLRKYKKQHPERFRHTFLEQNPYA